MALNAALENISFASSIGCEEIAAISRANNA